MKRITHFNKEVRRFMKVRVIRFGLTLAAALVIATSLSFAGGGRFGFGKSSTKSVSVTLDKATKLNNDTVLQPGEYTVKFPDSTQSPEVEFYTDGKLAAKAQAKVETQPQKNAYTSMELGGENGDVMVAINPDGLPERLVFNELVEK
jgi:hypothetical protein